ncbi:2-oxoglutarate carboxylase small subunit [compost metagenome]
MIAKLITYGEDRETAIRKMTRAIDEYQISGVQTTLPFCRFVMEHEAFINGSFDTNFVGRYFQPDVLSTNTGHEEAGLAALISVLLSDASREPKPVQNEEVAVSASKWKARRFAAH